jgi:hypothetical protein
MNKSWPSDDEEAGTSARRKKRPGAKKGGQARQRQLHDFLGRQPRRFVDALNVLHQTFGSAAFSIERARALRNKTHLELHNVFTPPDGIPDDVEMVASREPQVRATLWVAVNAIREAVHQIIKQNNPRTRCVRHILLPALHQLRDLKMGFEAKRYQIELSANPGVDAFELRAKGGLDGRSLEMAVRMLSNAAYCYIGVVILENFLELSAEYLRRLRRCKWPKCPRPYFVDRAAAARAAYCPNTDHRIKHWRELNPKERGRLRVP